MFESLSMHQVEKDVRTDISLHWLFTVFIR